MLIRILIVLLAFEFAYAEESTNKEDIIAEIKESATVVVEAKVIERTAPRYPRIELEKGNEAWIHVEFCIDETGKTRNIAVLDSVGNNRFEKAATRVVEDWSYEPALVDGIPTWQSRNQVYITFALEGERRGASRRFHSAFKRLGKLIDNEKLQEADELFQKIHETYDMTLYELSKLWAQRVRYEALTGDMHKLETALHRAAASRGEWIDKRSYRELLVLRAKVQINNSHFQPAIDTFEELRDAVGDDADEVIELAPVFDRLRTAIAGDEVIRLEGGISNSGIWRFTPVRRSFTLADLGGSLTEIEMRCDHKRYESLVSDEVDWHIPESWGRCRVKLTGEPGTTFSVLQLPDV